MVRRFEADYVSYLPDTIKGEDFLEVYRSHDDPITRIKPKKSYAIQAPTAHPIYENFRVKVCAVKFLLS